MRETRAARLTRRDDTRGHPLVGGSDHTRTDSRLTTRVKPTERKFIPSREGTIFSLETILSRTTKWRCLTKKKGSHKHNHHERTTNSHHHNTPSRHPTPTPPTPHPNTHPQHQHPNNHEQTHTKRKHTQKTTRNEQHLYKGGAATSSRAGSSRLGRG